MLLCAFQYVLGRRILPRDRLQYQLEPPDRLRLDCMFGQPETRGDFLLRDTLDTAKLENLPARIRQGGDDRKLFHLSDSSRIAGILDRQDADQERIMSLALGHVPIE